MKLRFRLSALAVAAALVAALSSCSSDSEIVLGSPYERPDVDIEHKAGGEEAYARFTGDTLTVSASDPKYGGPQFVAKLFTEGLSRAPDGEEYRHYTGIIEERGCTAETLSALASKFFSADEFAAEKLTGKETLFAVYRAVLSRDPTEAELAAESGGDAAALAETLCATDEFAAMLPDIIRGPYHWGKNNHTAFTGEKILTSDDITDMLAEDSHVVLPQGTLVLVTGIIMIPEGGTIETEGNPTHYTKMARFLRQDSGDHHIVFLRNAASLKNIYVEGDMSNYELESVLGGSNVVVGGKGGAVIGCRISDSVSHQNLWAYDGSEYGHFARNLITGYAADHNKTWQDGISCLGTDFLIEYNDIVDVTDGCIALFRYVNEKGEKADYYTRAQNTIIRYNKIINAGNSAYVAYDHETGNYIYDKANGPVNPANMSGLVAYENQIWTSMRAHYHLLMTLSTVPWMGANNCDEAFGGSVYNNYTPEGCYALTACGIAADKVSDVIVRGNQFKLYMADWCPEKVGHILYAVNDINTQGDFQAGFENKAMTPGGVVFIHTLKGGLELEVADEVTLKEAIIFEEKQTIPAQRFDAYTR